MSRRFALLIPLLLAGCGSPSDVARDDDRVTQIFAHGFAAPMIDASGKRIGRAVGKPGRQGLIVAYEVMASAPAGTRSTSTRPGAAIRRPSRAAARTGAGP